MSPIMIRKILIPTDGYGLEDHVINYIARAFPFAEFHVISIINTYEKGVQLTNLLYEEMKKSAEKAVYEAREKIKEHGIENIKTTVGEGLPSKRILDYAQLYDIDLIAMRVYSRKHTASAYRIGSTMKNVLRKSRIPVLTLADKCNKLPIKKLLILTDGTKKSKMADNFGLLFASTYGLSVEILYYSSEGYEHGNKILNNLQWKAQFWNLKVEKSIVENMEDIIKHFENNDIAVMGIGTKMFFRCKIGHFPRFAATHSPIPVIFVHKMKERWLKRRLRK